MGGLFHHLRHPRRCYVICAVARSGSNLLSDGLRDTGRAGRPNQFFFSASIAQFRAAHGFGVDLSFADYVQEMVKRTATSNEVFGFKLMSWYLEDFLARLRQTVAFAGPDDSDLTMLERAFPRLQFIQITRREKLLQAISKARALQTGLWKVEPGRKEFNQPRFDRDLIKHCLKDIGEKERVWSDFFARIKREPFQVTYEELCQNYTAVMSQVIDFLQIRLPRRIRIGPPTTIRQGDALSEEWAQRYRAGESAA